MTFTVVARCEHSGRLGVAIATYSLAVGGYCPFFVRARAVLSTQAFANPALGPLACETLGAGSTPAQVLALLRERDAGFDYRQVVMVDASGQVAAHTGSRCRQWAGHEAGEGWVVFGNVLAGPTVLEAMASAMNADPAGPLDERLLRCIEAGRDAGGQRTEAGEHLAERSAALIVRGADIVEDVDLRVDVSEHAIEDLRRAHSAYAPYLPYYHLRARDPANTPAQDVWAREHLGDA